MGQATSTERRQRRRQITAQATRAIDSEPTVRARGVLALVNPAAGGIHPDTVRQVRSQQMRRGGQPFTKADLVALLHTLTDVDVMAATHMTCEDLRVAIRVRLYTATATTEPAPEPEPEPDPNPVADIPDAPPAYQALPAPSAPSAPSAPPAPAAAKM